MSRGASLALAVRALRFRSGVSFAAFVVAVFVVGAATSGPVYYRAASESVLRDTVTGARTEISGVDISDLQAPGPATLAGLQAAVATATAGSRVYEEPISALEYDLAVADVGLTANGLSRLAYRSGFEQHVRLVAGRLAAAPGEVAVSATTVRDQGWRPGTGLVLTDQRTGEVVARPRVVGVYDPVDPTEGYWFGRAYYGADRIDALFTVPDTFSALPPGVRVRSVVNLPLRTAEVRLAGESAALDRLEQVQRAVAARAPEAAVFSGLPEVLDTARQSRELLRTPVLLVVLQLLVLSWLVLFTVVSNSVDARGAEVGLAKLRGLRPGSTVGFALLEPLLLLAVAAPFGVLAGLVTVQVVADRQLLPDTPVTLTAAALGAAMLALFGGAVAAAAAARRTLVRPALEQFRSTGVTGARRGWAADAVVLSLAGVGLVQLFASGTVRSGEVDPVALLAPGLLSLGLAVLAARLLPVVCRGLVGPTRGRRGIGTFLAVRQVARRPSSTRVVVVLVMAFGLATFSVAGWSVARDNREARALTEVGAPTVLTVEAPAGRDAAAAVAEVDPAGRWAMAVSELQDAAGGSRRLLAVDPGRLASVGYWRDDFSITRVNELPGLLHPAVPGPIDLTADGIGVRVRVERLQSATPVALRAAVRTPAGAVRSVELGVLAAGPARTLRGAAPDCRSGCELVSLVLARTSGFGVLRGSIEISAVETRTAGVWTPVTAALGEPGRWRGVTTSDPAARESLRPSSQSLGSQSLGVEFVSAGTTTPGIAPVDSPRPLPAVVTGSLLPDDPAEDAATLTVPGLDTRPLVVAPVSTAVALPRVAADGLLVDRDYARRQAGASLLSTEQVWLGPDAPADAVARLVGAGFRVVTTDSAAQVESVLARQGPALALLLFLLGAASAAVLAAGGTVLNLYLLGRRRSLELAAMLAVGVRRRSLLAAVLIEQGLLVGCGTLLGVAAGLLGATLALPSVPEFVDVPAAPPLLYTPDALLISSLVAGTVAILAVVLGLAAAVLVRSASPAKLREVGG